MWWNKPHIHVILLKILPKYAIARVWLSYFFWRTVRNIISRAPDHPEPLNTRLFITYSYLHFMTTCLTCITKALSSPSPSKSSNASAVLFQVKITQVELNVALYCANGYNTKQIGRKLGRSHRTIESTKRRIHLKLKVRNDAQMVSELFRRKIIS